MGKAGRFAGGIVMGWLEFAGAVNPLRDAKACKAAQDKADPKGFGEGVMIHVDRAQFGGNCRSSRSMLE